MSKLTDEMEQQEVCDDFHKWTMEQMLHKSPVMVFMTILGQTLKVMKTTMPPVEYQAILDNVYDSKDRIKPFTKPTIN